jgi:hypothetical protein
MQSESVYDEEYLNYALKLLELDPAIDEPLELVSKCARLILQIHSSDTAVYKSLLYKYTSILLDRIDIKVHDRISWELLSVILRDYS